MNQPRNPHKKRSGGMREVKVLLLSLSTTSILGFWILFARQAQLEADQAAANSTQTTSAVATQPASDAFLSSLPPIPTLVPTTSQTVLLPGGTGNPLLVSQTNSPLIATPVVAAPPSRNRSVVESPDRQKNAGGRQAPEPAAQTHSS